MFLSVATGLAESAGGEVRLTVRNGDEVLLDGEFSPRELLEESLRVALSTAQAEVESIYELVDPASAEEILDILEGLGTLAPAEIPEITAEEERESVIFVGSLVHNGEFLIDLAVRQEEVGGVLRVFTASRPWADVESLEERYVIYQSHNRILRALRERGAEVVEFEEMELAWES